LNGFKAEIQRIKEAFKAASDERKFMLQQDQEIKRIRQSTKKIWNEVGNFDISEKPDTSVSSF